MWIDVNQDGQFDSTGQEFIDNDWGEGKVARIGEYTGQMQPGIYGIRIQYEEAVGANVMQLLASTTPPDLTAPRGIAVDSTGRTIVADSSSHFATVYSSSGEIEFVIGGSGSAAGQLEAPWDVAVDRSDNIYVVERDNHRVQIFDAQGTHQHTIGGSGTAPGEFDSPEGIHFDPVSGHLYAADTGNHRIQRFSYGQLDTSFGDGCVVGMTGVRLRGHDGFDRPTDVAIRPDTAEIYVTDFGNCRLEVFNSAGEYQRTYHGIYQPNALAFSSNGDLYIAGTDDRGHNRGMEGHLGRLRADAELIRPGVTIHPVSELTTEAGDTAIFAVVLDSEPTSDVTIAFNPSDTTEGTVSTTSLTFTAANWDSPQTVTVTGMNDDLNDGDANYTISLGPITSADTDYAALAPVDVSLTNADDDSSGTTVDAPTELTTTEVGGETTFTVVLDCEPADDVTIAVSSSDTSEGTVSPTSLTFTDHDWDTPQTVTVTGVDDYMADGDVPYTVTIAAAVSNDTDYDGVDVDDLAVTNEAAFTPVDLGPIDFRRMATLAPTAEGLWFRLETSHDAWLTIESATEWAETQLAFRLYAPSDTDTLLATSVLSNGRPRIDHRVDEGHEFLLRVAGSAADVDLRLANPVHEADGAVTVHGTDQNDVFLFDAAASRKITINDVAYHYENTEVSTVDFDGGNGMDVVWFYDSPGNESLEAWPDRAVLTNSASDSEQDYAVEATGYESLLAYATRGGDDSATLHGSEASDKLKSYADSLRLRAKNSI